MLRPRGVTLLAILALVVAGSNLLTGAMLVTGNLTFDQIFGPMPDLGEMQGDFEHFMKFIFLMVSVVILCTGLGLLGLRNWARITMRVLAILSLLGALISMGQAFMEKQAGRFLFSAILGGIYYWAFHYLGLKPVRAAFVPPPPAGSEPPPPGSPGPGSAG